MLVENKTHD